jgi:3D (Asp-Asp-Asp) domain-containing protein
MYNYAFAMKTPPVANYSTQNLFLRSTIPPIYAENIGIREITAYSSDPAETDDTPTITASNKEVREGVIACPRYIPFGTYIGIDLDIDGEIDIVGICEDRMALKNYHAFDIWFADKEEAKQFGRLLAEVSILY